MSDLQKAFVKSRLAKLPPELPLMEDDESSSPDPHGVSAHHDDDSSSTSSAGTVVPSPNRHLFARPDRR